MAVDIKSKEGLLLRKMIPLATLPKTHFEAVCAKSTIENAAKGFVLFKKGDENTDLFYLLYGEVILEADGLRLETISAQSETARFALAHQIPRKIDALASSNIRYIRIDPETINNAPEAYSEVKNDYTVTEEADDSGETADDWMTQLLRKAIFQRLPGSNLQQILTGLREVEFKGGEVIVKQGEPGDYYYVIIDGECLLTRKPSDTAKEIKLGKLGKLNTFGEDALLSGLPRNVSVRAKTDVKLLRLDRQNFISLIQEPSLKYIDYISLQQELDQGAVLLDVRSPDAFQVNSLSGSINAPFFSLRMYIKNLNRKRKVIVVCEDGKISASAAFLLLGYKLNVEILAGGMKKVQPANINFSATFEVKDGIETIVNDSDHEQNEEAERTGEEKYDDAPEVSASHEESLDVQLQFLKTENESLRETIHQLTKKYNVLVQEKERVEAHLQDSKRNTEKLKNALKKINS